MEKILITGATGNTGLETIRFLTGKNVFVRAGVRDFKKDRQAFENFVEPVEFDFQNTNTYQKALEGITKVFLVRPPAISNVKKYIFPFIDACKKHQIQQIVFLSLMGVESNPVTPHYKIEKYIIASGIPYTFIRPSFFMQNLSTTHKSDIKNYNEIFVPAGKGKTSFIDVRDIAEISALTLISDEHKYKAYELSGYEALDYYQVAQLFSEVLQRSIKYSNPSIFKFFFRMKKSGIPVAFIIVMIALYSVAKFGLAGKITNEVERLLKRKPISMKQFIEDNKYAWAKEK